MGYYSRKYVKTCFITWPISCVFISYCRYLIKAILSNETDFEMSMAVETGSYLDLGDAENEDEPTVEKKRRCCFS